MSATRENILLATRDIYLAEGMGGLSMRRIAKQVGVSAPAIYRHYKDKDALLIAVVEEGYRLFSSYLHRALEADNPKNRLVLAGQSYVDFALQNPAYYNLIFGAPELWRTPQLPDHVKQRSNATFNFLVDRIRDSSSNVPADSASKVARSVWAMTHGLVTLHLSGKLGKDEAEFREIFNESMKHLFTGLSS